MKVDYLAKSIQIGNKIAANRFVVLPCESNDGLDSGTPSERTVGRYKRYAEGQAGIVCSESVVTDLGGRARIHQLCLGDETVDDFARMVDEVRKANPAIVFIVQVDHCGSLADPGFADPVTIFAGEPQKARLLTDDDIQRFRDKFIHTALLAHKAGADGVDIKFAHGFLAGEFLQPANTRDGRYGGPFENRTRFFQEVIEGIKQEVNGGDFLLSARISAYEGVAGGFGTSGPGEIIEDLSEPVAFARLAQETGLHFISVSAGSASGNLEILLPTHTFPDGVYRHFGWTRAVKQAIDIPVIGAGYSYLRDGRNHLTGEDPVRKSLVFWAEKNIEDRNVDLVGIGRQAIADPLLPKKVLNGDLKSVNWCIMCMDCGMLLGEQKEVGCSVYNPYYKGLVADIKAEA